MAAPISFQGLSTSLPTDGLISSVLAQEGQPMVRMQTKQALNNTKTAALSTIKVDLTSLGTSMSSLMQGGFQTRTVTSNDPSNANVTATASGANPGAYDISVSNVATRARLLVPPVSTQAVPPGTVVAPPGVDPKAKVGEGDYTLTDMDGVEATVTIGSGNNTLAGLRDAINGYKDASGTGLNVSATIVQTGTSGTSQLVLSANNTGTGKNGAATFSLAGPGGNALGLPANGNGSSTAVDANFTLNGVALQRASNTVSDAVDGVTFNLQAGNPNKTTTLTVGLDKTAITAAMQKVVTQYNTLYNDYKSKTGSTTNADGTITKGVFNDDSAIRGMIAQAHTALMGDIAGLPAGAPFNAPSGVGLKTNRDGTLALDSTAFQAALDKDANGVANVFNNTGTSSSPLLTFMGATTATASTPITFSIGEANGEGVSTGTFSTISAAGVPVSNTITSSNGHFYGANGSPFEGLNVKAAAGAEGTLTISKGTAQKLTDAVQNLTSSNVGSIGSILQNISTQNNNLTNQVHSQQERLARRKVNLQNTYSKLETTVGSLQAAGQSVSSM